MAETQRSKVARRRATPKADSHARVRSPKTAGAPRRPTSTQRAAPMPGTSNLRAQMSPEELHALIAEAAYYRAESRGFEPGHEIEDWIEAEAEIIGRLNADER